MLQIAPDLESSQSMKILLGGGGGGGGGGDILLDKIFLGARHAPKPRGVARGGGGGGGGALGAEAPPLR